MAVVVADGGIGVSYMESPVCGNVGRTKEVFCELYAYSSCVFYFDDSVIVFCASNCMRERRGRTYDDNGFANVFVRGICGCDGNPIARYHEAMRNKLTAIDQMNAAYVYVSRSLLECWSVNVMFLFYR